MDSLEGAQSANVRQDLQNPGSGACHRRRGDGLLGGRWVQVYGRSVCERCNLARALLLTLSCRVIGLPFNTTFQRHRPAGALCMCLTRRDDDGSSPERATGRVTLSHFP